MEAGLCSVFSLFAVWLFESSGSPGEEVLHRNHCSGFCAEFACGDAEDSKLICNVYVPVDIIFLLQGFPCVCLTHAF